MNKFLNVGTLAVFITMILLGGLLPEGVVAAVVKENIALTNNTVAENEPVNTKVGEFWTVAGNGDNFTYELISGNGDDDNGFFSISGSNLLTAAVFDFETKSDYSIRVKSTNTDNISEEYEDWFNVYVTNVNEAPTGIILSNNSTAENAPIGTAVIGFFNTVDPDVGDNFTYTFVSCTGSDDNNAFLIEGNQLKNGVVFDFEIKSLYTIRVKSTDNVTSTLSCQQTFTIAVTNVNEPPTDISLSSTSIQENQPAGTAIGNFSTTDPDVGDTFTYALVVGTGDADNGSFTIEGDTLKSAAVYDYETKNSYNIRVMTTDNGSLLYEEAFTITVTNEQAPTATFSGSPTTGTAPLTVLFTDLSANAPTSWFWQFGDGATSTSQNPSHTYNNAGTYTVTLTATNTSGNDEVVKTDYITVSSSSTGGTSGGGGTGGGGPTGPGITSLSPFINSEGIFNLECQAFSDDKRAWISFAKGVKAANIDGTALKSVSVVPMAETPAPPDKTNLVTLAYTFGPAGATFVPDVSISFNYDPTVLSSGYDENDLVIVLWNASTGKWEEQEGAVVDPAANTVTLEASHFSVYAVLTHIQPASFSIGTLNISPEEANPGETISIRTTVYNIGNLPGLYTVTLRVDGATEATQRVNIAGNSEWHANFEIIRDNAGTYKVDVNGMPGSFTVRESSATVTPAKFTLKSLEVSPHEVDSGKEVIIQVTVENIGNVAGIHMLTFCINDVVVTSKAVDLEPHSKQTVEFKTMAEEPGTQYVDVNGEKANFIVRTAPTPEAQQFSINWWLIGGIIFVAATTTTIILLRKKEVPE